MSDQFPPFGEDLRDMEGNPLVIWDFTNNLRVEYASDGTTTTRAFTPEELAEAPSIIASRDAKQAHEADRTTIRAIINDIKLEQDRVQTVLDNVNSTAREKDLARAAKRMGAAIIDLARFVKDMQ